MGQELIVRREGVAGFLTLNRPDAIHALTLGMCHAMTEALLAWKDDPGVQAVIVDHSEGRGFCSGGDIAAILDSLQNEGGVTARQFFFEEYRLNHLLFTYPKPVISFMDGITMGGGVGVSQPARFRVATENTRFAMPETGIGLFPDVGGGWYLSRLPGRVGQFLALTGARLDGAECLWAGLATHYLPVETLAAGKRRIATGEDIASTLAGLAAEPPQARIAGNAGRIARHFAPDRLEDVITSLAADASDWAAKELATIRTKSPTSQKVALRQQAEGARFTDFAENMTMEYRLAVRTISRSDFIQGVSSIVVDRSKAPQWNPATPEEVTDGLIDSIFAPLPAAEEWQPL